MVNCIAIVLGSPSDSNHMYPRVFDVSHLEKKCSPGSHTPERSSGDNGVH